MAGTIHEHIETYQTRSGGPAARILGTRIRVRDIVHWHINQGMSIDELEENFPTITRGDIHAALCYYWDNREDLEAQFARDDAHVEELLKDHVSPLDEKLARVRRGEAQLSDPESSVDDLEERLARLRRGKG